VFLVGALLFVWLSTAAIGHFLLGAFSGFGAALWESTTHLLEPGSIDYDDTAAERAIGLIQVIAGLIFLAGVVLTVLTEAVQRALSRFQGSDPAISRSGHLLLVGFNSALGEIEERLGHYVEGEMPDTVVLLPEALAERREDARRALRGFAGRATVMVADLESDGFTRACAGDAERIVILSPDGPPEDADLEVMWWATKLADHLAPLGAEAPPVGVEMRRHRNVHAFWVKGAAEATGNPGELRFPPNFDALVRDRIIGGTLSLAISKPEFAGAFLDIAGTFGIAPRLDPAGHHAGSTFGEARTALEPTTLLGLLAGTGPTATADYLPTGDRVIRGDERLIVIPRSPGHVSDDRRAIDPSQVKVSPSRPGPVMLVGFSDATRAAIEDLTATGYDGSRLNLLSPVRPGSYPTTVNGTRPIHIEGSPLEPSDLGRAIDQVDPAIVFVAAPDDQESAAVISALMAAQRCDAPIVVEQSSSDRSRAVRGATEDLTIVSMAGLVAENIATSSADPALLVATQALTDDPELEIESLVYASREPLPIDGLSAAFGSVGSIPIGLSLNDERSAPGYVQAGDHILVLQRVEPA